MVQKLMLHHSNCTTEEICNDQFLHCMLSSFHQEVSHKYIEECCASIAVSGSNLGASDPIIPIKTSKGKA
jgi:hypothetical protein